MNIKFFASLTLFSLVVSLYATAAPKDNSPKREKTAFQTAGPWKPVTDVRSDLVSVYGTWEHHGPNSITFEQRFS